MQYRAEVVLIRQSRRALMEDLSAVSDFLETRANARKSRRAFDAIRAAERIIDR
jgi:hypothetical protein